jgi:hypothetical protein
MATYKQIQDDVKKKHGRGVKTCWIAHVKEMHGLKPRLAPNRIFTGKRANPCPDRVIPLIEDSMRRLGMI